MSTRKFPYPGGLRQEPESGPDARLDDAPAAALDAATLAALDAALEGREPPTEDARAAMASALRALEIVDGLPRPTPAPGLRRALLSRLDRVDEARARRPLARLWAALRTPTGGGLALAGAAAATAAVLFTVGPDEAPREVPEALARMEKLEVAEDLELYENLDVLEHLDVLDDLELIEELPEESG